MLAIILNGIVGMLFTFWFILFLAKGIFYCYFEDEVEEEGERSDD